jgi:mxaC protein
MMPGVLYPWMLALLPLAAIPWWRRAAPARSYSWLALVPQDRLSTLADLLLRALGSVAIALIVLGLSGVYLPQGSVERIGRGAEIVLLLDRSTSMDQPFTTVRPRGDWLALRPTRARDSKGHLARQLLAQLAAKRTQDSFAMVLFSTYPIPMLGFTHKPDVVQAAIAASGNGRGLSETDLGQGLITALQLFAHRAYAGSRVLLLVSDGGAHLDPDTQKRIGYLLRRYRVTLYWIYLRSYGSPGLTPDRHLGSGEADTVPEHFLNQFFAHTGTPYRAYEAENPQALKRAIADVGRLQNLPLRYSERVPRRSLSDLCYGLALACTLLLAAAYALMRRRER